jgi:hypothetical protein
VQAPGQGPYGDNVTPLRVSPWYAAIRLPFRAYRAGSPPQARAAAALVPPSAMASARALSRCLTAHAEKKPRRAARLDGQQEDLSNRREVEGVKGRFGIKRPGWCSTDWCSAIKRPAHLLDRPAPRDQETGGWGQPTGAG